MLTKIKKAAKALFMTAFLATFLFVGATPTYAWLKYIHVSEDGSFFAISCGSSAGPTAIAYDAVTGVTTVIGAANPEQCVSSGPDV
jgi:hypothetical protein